jgi:hypothetical protein
VIDNFHAFAKKLYYASWDVKENEDDNENNY